jgi:hypothetical protein
VSEAGACCRNPEAALSAARDLDPPFRCRLRATIFQRSFLGKTKDDASQLNRLGVAYFHLCFLPISATCYFGFSSAHNHQYCSQSDPVSDQYPSTPQLSNKFELKADS